MFKGWTGIRIFPIIMKANLCVCVWDGFCVILIVLFCPYRILIMYRPSTDRQEIQLESQGKYQLNVLYYITEKADGRGGVGHVSPEEHYGDSALVLLLIHRFSFLLCQIH